MVAATFRWRNGRGVTNVYREFKLLPARIGGGLGAMLGAYLFFGFLAIFTALLLWKGGECCYTAPPLKYGLPLGR